MMGPRTGQQDCPFYEFNIEDRIPADHLLRRIDAVLDLSWVRSELSPFYSHDGLPPMIAYSSTPEHFNLICVGSC